MAKQLVQVWNVNTTDNALDKDERLVRVWNIDLVDGRKVKVATIEQPPRKPGMCEGCSAPCCQGILRPVLNSEEFTTKRFPHRFTPLPIYLAVQGVQADYLATLDVPFGEPCRYFDKEKRLCILWPNPPTSCLTYDCRDDDRPEIKGFVKQRRKEWKKIKRRLISARNC